ncbi:MAG: trypsin-like peptidase domain-containing protein [Deltaproteobacteria bacterium]|nr:trypsin-like peptidase domain-containing protein [Deltaproteobacteria bacterium]MBW2360586.1 trypsin-like peptidase domain-containing protein [Deltaproteobacteria bacterium]
MLFERAVDAVKTRRHSEAGTALPRRAALLLLLLGIAAPATGILVDTSTPELYERPPPDDPGWRNVGRRGATSAIYLGKGWVLTARHAAAGAVEFDGQTFLPVEASVHWISSPTGGLKADLLLFQVTPEPDLPALDLRRQPLHPDGETVMIGYGLGRGDPALSGPGFRFDGRGVKRWGSNRIAASGVQVRGPKQTLTQCFSMVFSAGGSAHEAQATVGDSGGAVFLRGPKRWQLAGVLLSISGRPGQSSGEALFGNTTHAADIGAYAPEILAVLEGRFSPPTPQPAARGVR